MATTTTFTVTVTMPDGKKYHARSEMTKDYSYYSKAWHRRYGSKKTETNRRVEVEDPFTKQVTVVATYKRWPKSLPGDISTKEYLAILMCLRYTDLPALMGTDKTLDDCISYLFSKGEKHG